MTNNKAKRIIFINDSQGRVVGYTTLGKYAAMSNAIGSNGRPMLNSQPSYAKTATKSAKPCCGKKRK